MEDSECVAVLGAGTMGRGIARVAAGAGYRVWLHDVAPEPLREALEQMRASLDRGVERGALGAEERERALARVRATGRLAEAVAEAGWVIEAVPERMELKKAVFRELDALAPADARLASNTSSLSISEIAEATGRPGAVVGLHFFNPVHRMRLLEVVRGRRTSDDTVAAAVGFARAIGKQPIVVSDTPGFASSRLGVVLGLEAMRMVEEGVAAPEAIDAAMELGYNHPVGPLRLTDLVGLDVRLGIAEYLYERLGGQQFRPPEILRRMVAEGKLGRKSGQGFYRWEEPRAIRGSGWDADGGEGPGIGAEPRA